MKQKQNSVTHAGLKILSLTPWYPPTPGAQEGSFITDSVAAVTSLGNQVSVLVTRPWKPNAQSAQIAWNETQNNLAQTVKCIRYLSLPRFFLLGLSNWFYQKRIQTKIKSFIHQYNIQLIHAHNELAAEAAVNVGKQLSVPVVATLHGIETSHRFNSLAQHRKHKRVLNDCDAVILVGEPLREHYQQIAGIDCPMSIVPNGVRTDLIQHSQSAKRFQTNTRRIASVSNLVKGKGIDLNLRALATLLEEGIGNWRYDIVGDGPQRAEYKALAITLKLHDHVRFLGRLDHQSVFKVLSENEIFSLPSYKEAFGIAYLEAMVSGNLVIGVYGQGPSAFIKSNVNGLLVEGQSIDSLKAALKQAIVAPESAGTMADKGRENVLLEYTWSEHARKLVELYHQVIFSHRKYRLKR